MDAIEIIAHRGSSYLAPENTCAAVELAWQEGADAVEGDFRLTADGHIVAMHDATLKRTAGIDRRVAECSLEELRTYDVGSWKNPQFADEPVPTLAEMLATVPAGKRFLVELKCSAEIVEPLQRLLADSEILSQTDCPNLSYPRHRSKIEIGDTSVPVILGRGVQGSVAWILVTEAQRCRWYCRSNSIRRPRFDGDRPFRRRICCPG